MFNYKLLIVLVIITIGSSIPVRKSLLNEPKPCCVPKQYSSKMSMSQGMSLSDAKIYGSLSDSISFGSYDHYNFSYDENLGMVGMKGFSFNVPDEEQTKLWIIVNMKYGQIYRINLDTKQCHKLKSPISPMRCIPEDATYIDSTIYGYGDQQILGDTWLIKLNGTITYSTVSRGACVPLTTNIFMKESGEFFSLEGMFGLTTTNFVERIDDPSIFDIPPECKDLF